MFWYLEIYLKHKIFDRLQQRNDLRGHTHTQDFSYHQRNQLLPFHISPQSQHRDQ